MEDKLENTAHEALRAIIDNAAAAKDFILAELPDVVQQLLTWKMCESMIYFIGSWLVVGLIVINAIKLHKHCKKHDYSDTECLPWAIISSFGTVLGIMFACICANLTWLQIWIAPKVYLLEYATSLVK